MKPPKKCFDCCYLETNARLKWSGVIWNPVCKNYKNNPAPHRVIEKCNGPHETMFEAMNEIINKALGF